MISPGARTVGLLAGTFDPVHLGHVELARSAVKAGLVGEVWFIVDPKRVSSHAERKQPVAGYDSRTDMVRIAISNEPYLRLYEGALAGSAHTSRMFRQLMDSNPQNEFSFVVGSDTFQRIATWEDIDCVVERSTFIVGARAQDREDLLLEVTSELGSQGDELRVIWLDFDGFRHVSSTDVRASLRQKGRLGDLSPEVRAHIESRGLYL